MNKLFLILVLAFLVRFPLLEKAPYSDEILWNSLSYAENMLDTQQVLFQPPVSHFFFSAISVFTVSFFGFRLAEILLQLATLVLIYRMGSLLYGDNVGLLAAFLGAFLFYPVATSTIIEVDGLLVFTSWFAIYLYLKYTKTDNSCYLFSSMVLLGCTLLIRANAIWVAMGIFIYHLIKYGCHIKQIKYFVIPFLIYLLFPLFAYFYKGEWSLWSYFLQTIIHIKDSTVSELPFGIAIPILFLWATPILILIPLLSKPKEEDYFFIVLFGVVIFFLVFVVSKGGYDRYWTLVLPILLLYTAKSLIGLQLTAKEIYKISSFAFIFFLVYELLSLLLPIKILTRSFGEYFFNVLNLDWFFLFPLTIDHGQWFGVNFFLIAMTWIFVVLFFLSAKFYNYRKSLFLLLGISLGYNLFLVYELVNPTATPDYSSVVWDAVNVAKELKSTPVYATDKDLLYLYEPSFYDFYPLVPLHKKNIEIKRYRIEGLADLQKIEKGTIIFINFTPYVSYESILVLPYCQKQRSYEKRGLVLGGVFKCKK